MAASSASFAPKDMPMFARLPALLLTPERDVIHVGSSSVRNVRITAPAGLAPSRDVRHDARHAAAGAPCEERHRRVAARRRLGDERRRLASSLDLGNGRLERSGPGGRVTASLRSSRAPGVHAKRENAGARKDEEACRPGAATPRASFYLSCIWRRPVVIPRR